jgi:hypothetical protein
VPSNVGVSATKWQLNRMSVMQDAVSQWNRELEAKSMGIVRRLASQDPARRQITFLAIGAYSGCFFSVVLVLVAMISDHKVGLGLMIAAVILVVELPLSRWIVQSARRKQISGQSNSSGFQNTFSSRK